MGRMYAAASSRGLCRLTWLVSGPKAFVRDLRSYFPDRDIIRVERGDKPIEREIKEYLAGRRRSFDLTTDLSSLSDFERRVLRHAQKVPFGATVSYGDLARRVRRPGAARAVGNALRKNPLAIVVPCHRIIRSDGSLGGYCGRSAVGDKQRLLNHESRSQPLL
jgi:methylated-DNA-[protein]-cysteine S-methyltransferase